MPTAGNALFGLLHVYKRALRERYLRDGITLPLSHLRVLGEIGRHDGVMAREVATALLQDKGLITRVTRELEREGLIERHPHPTDSRAAHLALSADGRALRERLDAIEQTLEAQMAAGLSPARTRDFIDTVNAMTDQLDRDQESP
ncbi:MarR family winged helix-turn-helix transcriptional regulator [Kushneria indalinina]|uniref:DNA-binding MarR family transcriptional regulator n=1 Tax=Kushneria indalinina DSM 14324 TaxID=1122140 RepID=A0A3D9DW85_9GAMM|nr:MarR family transcriptional regulator [Kushneria indalinina]REC95006.1 DNA-binding MarR family transcriptional regulator [Kushneria indalinina DSM 14324]